MQQENFSNITKAALNRINDAKTRKTSMKSKRDLADNKFLESLAFKLISDAFAFVKP